MTSRKSRDISLKEMIEHRGDIHHIFPRQYLKEHGFSQSQYNQVANYVYVQQEINIKVGKRSLADYIGQIREQCQSGTPASHWAKAPRGYGWITNPKKALYNRVYYRTTRGCSVVLVVLLSAAGALGCGVAWAVKYAVR